MADYLLPWLVTQQMDCYLPLVRAHALSFVKYQVGEDLRPNQYGILEPVERRVLCKPADLDTVIVPLLAFTARCERLGRGAGHYDTAFAFLNQRPRPAHPVLIGLAYDFQEAATLVQHERDVQLDYVVTESAIFRRQA